MGLRDLEVNWNPCLPSVQMQSCKSARRSFGSAFMIGRFDIDEVMLPGILISHKILQMVAGPLKVLPDDM